MVLSIAIPLLAVPACMFGLLVLGVLWSPFAALSCAALGRREVMSKWSYAVEGLASSTALLAPWVYLVTRILGLRLPVGVVRAAYAVLYAMWLVCLTLGGVFACGFFAIAIALRPEIMSAIWVFVLIGISILAALTALALRWSLRTLRRHHQEYGGPDRPVVAFAYLQPFWCMGGLSGVHAVVMLAVLGYGVSSTWNA